MEYKDYYKILGVERTADQESVKKAFRRMAAKYHPDRNKDAGAEDRFKELNEAYEVLGDGDKRARYDQLGASWHAGDNFKPPPSWGNNAPQFDASFFEHITRNGGQAQTSSGFSDFFDTLFGGGGFKRTSPSQSSRGQTSNTQTATIQLNLEDTYHGATKTIRLPSGENLQINIPAGTHEGQKIRLAGRGPQGSDMYLKIRIKEHPLYQREGNDLYMEIPITPWEAALGETVAIPTLAGKVSIKIPPGSHSGKKMRLKGRGIPGNEAGDLYVVLQVSTPPADTTEQKEYYARMKTLFAWNPRQHIT
jgi:curved DNA-binding protein